MGSRQWEDNTHRAVPSPSLRNVISQSSGTGTSSSLCLPPVLRVSFGHLHCVGIGGACPLDPLTAASITIGESHHSPIVQIINSQPRNVSDLPEATIRKWHLQTPQVHILAVQLSCLYLMSTEHGGIPSGPQGWPPWRPQLPTPQLPGPSRTLVAQQSY